MRSLLSSRRFAPLFWCQFFAAFNDNFLKNAIVLLILFKVAGSEGSTLVTLAGAVLIFPFIFLSSIGGEIADKFDKALIARRLKLIEIGAAGIAVAGFWLASIPVLFVALFLFGSLGAAFGPIKYGILPDHLADSELPMGNALIEGATFLAILLGTIVGGLAMAHGGGNPGWLAGGMMGFAAASYVAATFIPKTTEAAPDLKINWNIAGAAINLIQELYADVKLWRLAVVTSIFWLIGAVVMSLLGPLVTRILHGSPSVVTMHLAVFAVAVAIGSGIAAFMMAGRVVLLPTAVGALIIAIVSTDVGLRLMGMPATGGSELAPAAYFAQPHAFRVIVDMALLAMAGGLMIVPSFAAIQTWAVPARRARIVASVNVLNACFMTLGSVVVAAAQYFGASLQSVFVGVGIYAALMSMWIFKAVVTSPFQDFLSILFRAFYRLEVRGLDNFKNAGANPIIALNHVSFLDAALILSSLPFNPVFAIDRTIATRWWVRPFLRVVRAIPLDPSKPLGTRTLVNAVKNGDPLVIFPEGRLTVTGSLMKVYDGSGLIADKTGSFIVPVRIEGPEATIFSRLSREQVRRRWFPKFTLTIMPPTRLVIDENLKGKQRRMAAGAALYDVMSDLIFQTSKTDGSLFDAVIDAARIHGWSRVAVEDPMTGTLTYRKLLIAAYALGHKLGERTLPGEAVGVMLPNSNGAAVTIVALLSAGGVPAMINFTAGAASILSACTGAVVKTLLTSRTFVEKGRLESVIKAIEGSGVEIVYLEDVKAQIGIFDKLCAFLCHTKPILKRSASDGAVILFTSGSEGIPKGVLLTNRNLLANTAQAAARIDFGRTDKVFNVLPVFHCFGLNAGFFLPLTSGVPVYLYPSPLHYKLVPELVYGSNSTILFGTDTFLAGYARVAHPYDFRSVRYLLAGAEPVKASTRKTYAEKFGLRILEGYGVTETSPVLAINTPMFNRYGTVGRLMPGIEWQLEPMPGVEVGGRLLVKGPNIMAGYLKADAPGVLQTLDSGFYDTGDIVEIDGEGFVTIKGRAKRFVKIGGEMLSLASVEALAAELWPDALSAAARASDPKKGECILLFTQHHGAAKQEFQAFAKSRGASELAIPAKFITIDTMPLLGSGKLDFAAIDKLAREFSL